MNYSSTTSGVGQVEKGPCAPDATARLGSAIATPQTALVDWVASLPWHVRLDLTFRVGAEGCDVASITPARARRRLDAFLRRLSGYYQRRMRVFAAPEIQERGVYHWHVLVRFLGASPPWLDVHRVMELWQYWRGWQHISHAQGVEGHGWMLLVRRPAHARYAAKYAAKSGGEYLLCDVGPAGLFSYGSGSRDSRGACSHF